MLGALFDFAAGVTRAAGAAVGRISTGRTGAGALFGATPGLGPGEAPPLGPGLGAVPEVRATAAAVLVGLGFGTPERLAGASEARATGAAVALGAAVDGVTAAAVGDAFGWTGTGVAACALACTTGAAGFGEGRTTRATVGTGDGAAVGGGFKATATGPAVGTLTGAAGISLRGVVSKTFWVGCGFGCGVCCGIGRGFGGAVGAVFASSCRFTGSRCDCGWANGAWRTGAITGTCGTGTAARAAAG